MSFRGILSFFILLFTLGCLSIPIAAMGYQFIQNSTEDSYEMEEKPEIDSSLIEVPFDYERSPIFLEHWNTTQLNAYPNRSKINIKKFLKEFDSLQSFCFPVKTHITSNYGPRWGSMHHGIDVALQVGDTVCAAFDGKVRYASPRSYGYGNLVIIRHQNGLETYYAHLNKIGVQVGQTVEAGEYVGQGGRTGHVTGPHLHFETRLKGKSINPMKLIDRKTLVLRSNSSK